MPINGNLTYWLMWHANETQYYICRLWRPNWCSLIKLLWSLFKISLNNIWGYSSAAFQTTLMHVKVLFQPWMLLRAQWVFMICLTKLIYCKWVRRVPFFWSVLMASFTITSPSTDILAVVIRRCPWVGPFLTVSWFLFDSRFLDMVFKLKRFTCIWEKGENVNLFIR